MMRYEIKIIILAVIFGLFIGFVDSFIDYALFYDRSFWDVVVLDVPVTEVYSRFVLLVIFTVFGVFSARILGKRRQTEQILRESEEKFRSITAAAQDAIILIDENGLVRYMNKAAEAVTGYREDEMFGKDMHQYFAPQRFKHDIKTGFDAFVKTGAGMLTGRTSELVAVKKDGTEFPIELSIAPVQRNGKINAIGILRDISERKRVEKRLELSSRVMEHALEGIMLTDGDGRIEMVNQAFADITGYSATEVVGQNPHMLSSGRHDKQFYEEMWRSLKDKGKWQGEIWNRRKDGGLYVEWLRLSAIKDSFGQATNYVGIFSDITQRKMSEEQLQRLAHHDALTGLPNRILFNDRLEQAVREARRNKNKVAVLFLDLDHFKTVNDTYGHQTGDSLLMEVTTRIQKRLREEDTVARLGGDEFTIVLKNIQSSDQAAQVADKIVSDLREPFALNGSNCRIGASIGISIYPTDSEERKVLVKLADDAMYKAKQGGRNQYQIHENVGLK